MRLPLTPALCCNPRIGFGLCLNLGATPEYLGHAEL